MNRNTGSGYRLVFIILASVHGVISGLAGVALGAVRRDATRAVKTVVVLFVLFIAGRTTPAAAQAIDLNYDFYFPTADHFTYEPATDVEKNRPHGFGFAFQSNAFRNDNMRFGVAFGRKGVQLRSAEEGAALHRYKASTFQLSLERCVARTSRHRFVVGAGWGFAGINCMYGTSTSRCTANWFFDHISGVFTPRVKMITPVTPQLALLIEVRGDIYSTADDSFPFESGPVFAVGLEIGE